MTPCSDRLKPAVEIVEPGKDRIINFGTREYTLADGTESTEDNVRFLFFLRFLARLIALYVLG
jgi:hypothetical protein